MLKEELQAIDVDSLTEEEARVHCMDIVKNAVENNEILKSRYDNYIKFRGEL